MIRILFILSMVCASLFASVDSCREAYRVDREFLKNDFYDTEVFVLVDESTYFDNEAQEDIYKKIVPFVKQNTRINIDSFTEYSKTRKNKDLGSYYIYSDLTNDEKDEIGRTLLGSVKDCLDSAKVAAYSGIKKDLEKAFRKKNDNLKKSEILRNLRIYTRNNVRYSKAKRKVVIILSDMLQNSEYMSFYKNGKVKLLDIDKELDNVKKNRLFSTFNGAEVYTYGLGLVEINSSKDSARNLRVLDGLIMFWEDYVSESGGIPKGFSSVNMNFDIEY